MSAQRESLRSAHSALIAAQQKVGEAADIFDRAQRFVADCESECATFDDVAMAVNSERAEAVREALAAGLSPTMALSPSLLDRVNAKREAGTKLESARQALGTILGDLEEAQAAEQRAKGYVADAARVVLQAGAEALAQDVFQIEQELLTRRCSLAAVENLWAASSDGQSRPLRISQAAMNVMNDPGIQHKMASYNSPVARLKDSEAAKWSSYASRLLADPDAVYAAGDDSDTPLVVLPPPAANVAGLFIDRNPAVRARQEAAE